MKHSKICVGDKFKDVQGLTCTVIEYINSAKIKVEYEDGYTQYRSSTRLRGAFHKGGKGANGSRNIIGSKIRVPKVNQNLRFKHSALLRRLLSENAKAKNSSYQGVIISDDWLDFDSFLSWAEKQIGHEHKDWHIEKDILVKGNKKYSSETCCFVPLRVNILFTSRSSERGECPIGVHLEKKTGKYIASCRDGKQKVKLGRYDTPEDAFYAYKSFKEKVIKSVADEYRDVIDPKVYSALVNYSVDITD